MFRLALHDRPGELAAIRDRARPAAVGFGPVPRVVGSSVSTGRAGVARAGPDSTAASAISPAYPVQLHRERVRQDRRL